MNRLEIQVSGMSRSGNHAILDWVWEQAQGKKLLLNCAEGKTNPYLTCRPLADGRAWRTTPSIDIEAERAGRLSDKDLLVHSYEDSWLGHAFSKHLESNRDAWLGPSQRRAALLVLRDPFNLFASRLRVGARLPVYIARRMWKQHARHALSELRRPRGNPIVVLYNRWALDRDYRRALAERLGLPFSDASLDRVADCHGGSSFDGLAFDGRASAMAIGERWRRFVGDPRYTAIFDEEMMEMSTELFGPVPPIFRQEPALERIKEPALSVCEA